MSDLCHEKQIIFPRWSIFLQHVIRECCALWVVQRLCSEQQIQTAMAAFVTLKGRAKGQGEFGDFGDSVKLMLVKLKHSPSNLMESNIGWASCLKWDLTRDQSFEWQL